MFVDKTETTLFIIYGHPSVKKLLAREGRSKNVNCNAVGLVLCSNVDV
jgi:hypothetical protein